VLLAKQGAVQGACRFEVTAKGLFHHQVTPLAGAFCRQAGGMQLGGDVAKKVRWCCQVIQTVATRAIVAIDVVEQGRHACVGVCLLEIAVEVMNAQQQFLPEVGVHRLADVRARVLIDVCPVSLRIAVAAIHDNNAKVLCQQAVRHQVVQGRKQLALCKVTAGAEDYHDARWRRLYLAAVRCHRAHLSLAGFSWWPPNS
jgi:hypothetical protein